MALLHVARMHISVRWLWPKWSGVCLRSAMEQKKKMGPILNKSQFIGLTSQVGNALITFIL